jgi:hypothetical protein
MRFKSRAHLQRRRVDLYEGAIGEEVANGREYSSPSGERRAA